MIISDLNHVEVVSEATRIEGGYFQLPGHRQFDVIKGVVQYVSLTAGVAYNNVAVGSATAGAIGYDTFTKAATSTFTTPISSSSEGYSLSVSS